MVSTGDVVNSSSMGMILYPFRNVYQLLNGEEKSSFTFADAMAFVGGEMEVVEA